MTAWEKLKVVDLKEELKARGVPLTGLKLKQQLIDKLVELEAVQSEQDDGSDNAGIQQDSQAGEDHPQQVTVTMYERSAPDEEERSGQHVRRIQSDGTGEPTVVGQGEIKASDAPDTEPTIETDAATIVTKQSSNPPDTARTETEGLAPETSSSLETKVVGAISPEESRAAGTGPSNGSPPNTNHETAGAVTPGPVNAALGPAQVDRPETSQPAIPSLESPSLGSSTNMQAAKQPPVNETPEDQKKRKRRSVSPVPSSEDIAQKKAKVVNDTAGHMMPLADAFQQMQEATKSAEAIRGPAGLGLTKPEEDPINQNGLKTITREKTSSFPLVGENPTIAQQSSLRDSQPPIDERDVTPALHPATSSLYLRGFKRPLHIPSLRNHISSLAKSPEATEEQDPIKLFYLDSIRTHAFLSFRSVAIAARVRSAMHDTRFPDEPLREPLVVDFIPDEKVQSWIDEESGQSIGRGMGGAKYEVVYHSTSEGVEAKHQVIDQRSDKLPAQQGRPIQTPATFAAQSTTTAVGIHPDRVTLVPGAQSRLQTRLDSPPSRLSAPSNSGVGFKALDELFSFTSTKPKLYYKAVPETAAAERLDMIRDLRIGHGDMGKSGEEGMKRYTFELLKGREGWVDKGPEFGHGRRGQDRLAGVRGGRGGGGGFGGFRGAGGGRFDRGGGDSWRGR